MASIKARIKIIGTEECPLYTVGDEFKVSGKSLISPYGKATCLILASDMTELLIKYENIDDNSRYVFDCSGCTGIARLQYKRLEEPMPPAEDSDHMDIYTLVMSLSNHSFFQSLDEDNIKEILSHLKMEKYDAGDIILEKGEPGRNLFIIAQGKVEILDNEVRIAILGTGEIFGEMSLISGNPVTATVQALEPLTLLYLNGRYFSEILHKIPSIQIFLTRLLARRIAVANILRSREIASGLTGNLSQIPPAELLQTLNVNQKTGVLILKLDGGLAAVSFREGRLIRAKYGEKEDREAIFEIVKASSGRFKFNPELPAQETRTEEFENFMKLLMEAHKRLHHVPDPDESE